MGRSVFDFVDSDANIHTFQFLHWRRTYSLPASSGCYMITARRLDGAHDVLYVGGTSNFKERIGRHKRDNPDLNRHRQPGDPAPTHVFFSTRPMDNVVADYRPRIGRLLKPRSKGERPFDYECVLKFLFPDKYGREFTHERLVQYGRQLFGQVARFRLVMDKRAIERLALST